ncbi:hypothetical protein SAMN02787142_1248 [Burkholderia sp. WP9]|uniref:hypothetical protein n=1 Tax=Burkholderia sp. WP9 TaxID=1500263 RepID=UPI000898859D|nr:hypothetical protein [Burkholderia sp. WP9]SEC35544.1 hypothetical protein SAMN02787142_1248 [Burkholderia sp. WP9]
MSTPFSMSGPTTSNYAGPSDAATDNIVTFNDGSFTTAATPTPGLTAGLSNVTGGIASLGSAVSNLTSSASGIFMLVAVGGAIWLYLRKKL